MENKPTRKISRKQETFEASVLETGKRVENFVLKECVSKKEHAEVWKAENEFGTEFILKIMSIPESEDASGLIKSFNNFKKIQDFSNLVRYEMPVAYENKIVLPMEALTGSLDSLKVHILDSAMPVRVNYIIKTLLPQICLGLKTCNNSGFAHLDLKPSNILQNDSGRLIKLSNYGITRADSVKSATSKITGNDLMYLSPEQQAGKPGNVKSDIYSLGIIACEMLFDEPYPNEHPDVPDELIKILNRCIDINPSKRFSNVEELLESLAEIKITQKKAEPEKEKSDRTDTGERHESYKQNLKNKRESAAEFNKRFNEKAEKPLMPGLIIFTVIVVIAAFIFIGIVLYNELRVTPGEYFDDSDTEHFFYVFISQERYEEAYERVGKAYPQHREYLTDLVALAEIDSLIRDEEYQAARKVALRLYDKEKQKERLEVIEALTME